MFGIIQWVLRDSELPLIRHQAIKWRNKENWCCLHTEVAPEAMILLSFSWCFPHGSFYSIDIVWQRSNWNNLLKTAITHQHKDGFSHSSESESLYIATQALHWSIPRGTIHTDFNVNGFSRNYAIKRHWTALSRLLRIRSDPSFPTQSSPHSPTGRNHSLFCTPTAYSLQQDTSCLIVTISYE